MRIGILTFHRAYNCGAMLQAWALKTVLERMGHRVEFPACNSVGETGRWRFCEWQNREKKGLQWIRSVIGRAYVNFRSIPYNLGSIPCEGVLIKRYAAFRTAHLPERNVDPADFAKYYDLIVLGSDQIWHPEISRPNTAYFLGDEFPDGIRAISYAASFGDAQLVGDDLTRVVECARRLSAVSVRERLAKVQLEPHVGKPVFLAADPTLLLDAADYSVIAEGKVPKEPYLFMYTLFADPFLINTARELARRLGVRCVIAPCYQFSRYGAPSGLTYGISPGRLVQYARNAKYVLACSFHGTVMGVLFGKPFLSVRRSVDRAESRPASLLRMLGCEEWLVNPSVTVDEMCRRLISLLPDLTEKVGAMRVESMKWLGNALKR